MRREPSPGPGMPDLANDESQAHADDDAGVVYVTIPGEVRYVPHIPHILLAAGIVALGATGMVLATGHDALASPETHEMAVSVSQSASPLAWGTPAGMTAATATEATEEGYATTRLLSDPASYDGLCYDQSDPRWGGEVALPVGKVRGWDEMPRRPPPRPVVPRGALRDAWHGPATRTRHRWRRHPICVGGVGRAGATRWRMRGMGTLSR